MPISRFISGSMQLKCSLSVLAVLCLFLLLVSSASGQNADEMLKQFDKEYRSVQKDMFAGKSDEAVAGLEKLRDLLEQIKTADPKNSKLNTAEKKYEKLGKFVKAGLTLCVFV